jgi:CHAP domain
MQQGGGGLTVSALPEDLRACADAYRAITPALRIRVGGLQSSASGAPNPSIIVELSNAVRMCADHHDRASDKLNRIALAFEEADRRSSTVQDVLKTARAQVGYREKSGNRSKFGDWYGADGQPWCAMFVSWVFAQAGQPLPDAQSANGFAQVRTGWAYAKKHDRITWKPQPGDIFLIRSSGQKGHTGLVVSVDYDKRGNATVIHTIEGNTNAAGSREGTSVLEKTRSVASINHGFWRPFGEVTNAEQEPPKRGQTTWPSGSLKRRSARRRK